MILVLNFDFSAAHFYKQKQWSHKKNRSTFGKCYTQNGHGHNYHLNLEIDVGNTFVPNALSIINPCVMRVLNRLDHEHLNFKIPQFKNVVPTTENISLYIRDQLQIPTPFRLKLIRLFEMDSIFVELII